MTERFTWIRLPRLLTAALVVATCLGAVGIGLMPRGAIFVLAGVLGIGVLLIFIRRPLIGVGLCLTLVLSGGISQVLEGSLAQRLYSLTFVLTVAAYAHHLLSDRSLLRAWLRIRLSDVLVGLFFLIAILSLGVAEHPGEGVSRLIQLGKGVALYFLASRTIRSREDLLFVARFLLVGGLVQVGSAYTGSAFTATDSNRVLRVSGNLKDANAFAGALLPIVPWALFFLAFGRQLIWRLLGAVGAVLLPLTLLSSVSRSALVVLICIGLFWPMFSTRGFGTRAALLLLSSLLLSLAISIYWEAFLTRWRSLDEQLSGDSVTYVVDDDGGRAELRAAAWQVAREHPWLGVGIGNGGYEVGKARGKQGIFYSHNMYSNVAADLGFSGLGAFLALILGAYLVSMRGLLRLRRNEDRAILVTVITMLTCWTLFGLTLNTEYQNYAYGLLALCFITPAVLARSEAGALAQAAPPAALQWREAEVRR